MIVGLWCVKQDNLALVAKKNVYRPSSRTKKWGVLKHKNNVLMNVFVKFKSGGATNDCKIGVGNCTVCTSTSSLICRSNFLFKTIYKNTDFV